MGGSRCAAIVGPYLCGKTTVLESLLFTAGAIHRKGTIKEGNTVGDASAEAQGRQMSTEISYSGMNYLGDDWTLLDCPGSIELMQEYLNALNVADTAINRPASVNCQDIASIAVIYKIIVGTVGNIPRSVCPKEPVSPV